MSRIIVDTGPIVAILSRSDNYHKVCVETLKTIKPPMLTTWMVFTEAHYLLRRDNLALKGLFNAFEKELLALEEIPSDALVWLKEFCMKYEDINPQIADASLMYLAEKNNIDTIFTLDRRDFSIYRLLKKSLTIIPATF